MTIYSHRPKKFKRKMKKISREDKKVKSERAKVKRGASCRGWEKAGGKKEVLTS